MSATQIRCSEVVELVTDYLERELGAGERAAIDEHLRECDGCAAYLAQMRATIAALGRLGDEPAPPRDLDRLLAAFRERHRS